MNSLSWSNDSGTAHIFVDHFSGPDVAIGPVCVCVCVYVRETIFELTDIRPRYLVYWLF